MNRERQVTECIDPAVGRQIYIHIYDSGINRKRSVLTKEFEDHIDACCHCRALVPVWKIKASGLLPHAEKIVAEAKEGRPGILHRREGDIEVYFKPKTPNSTEGLIVKMRTGGEIISIDETSVENFNSD